jgi:hypothetical protein
MKKLLLFLFGALAFAGMRAQEGDPTDPSYWTEEKLAEYDASVTGSYADVIYMKSCIFPKGSTIVELPINVKAHQKFNNVQFRTVLPEGLWPETESFAYGERVIVTSTDRCPEAVVDGKNFTNNGYTQFITSKSSYSTKEDDVFFYIQVNIEDLNVGVYDLTVNSGAKVSGFEDDANGSVQISEPIVTKLVISNEVILDEEDEEYPGDYAGVNVKVLRTISAGKWNTLCLPFSMTAEQCEAAFGEGVKLAEYAGYETEKSNGKVTKINVLFDDIPSITANRPCIIKVSNAITHDDGFTVENVDIVPPAEADAEDELALEVGDGAMVGTYVNGTELFKDGRKGWCYIFLSGNKFFYATADTQPMKGFRAYFDFEDELVDKGANISDVKFTFNVNDEPTSIDGILSVEKGAEGVYTVSGQKLSDESLKTLPKGVYIVNGKKVYKK